MKHILSGCGLALNRYTWRHNKILTVLYEVATKQTEEGLYASKRKKPGRGRIEVVQGKMEEGKIEFVPQGRNLPGKKSQKEAVEEVIHCDESWEVSADLKGCARLLPIPTTKPDLVVWSAEARTVHLIELTVPHEDNIEKAHERKEQRYKDLVEECEEAGWQASHFPVEVGCRGFVAASTRKWLGTAGLSPRKVAETVMCMQETVEKASHWIWLKRKDDTWCEA